MRAVNHALTGAAIGLTVSPAAIALPLALLSHFALDAIPHHDDKKLHRQPHFNIILLIDAILCYFLVVWLFVGSRDGWVVPAVAAFLATSPDFMWVGHWRQGLHEEKKMSNWLMKFHSTVQWSQTPRGGFIEVVWSVVFVLIIAKLLAA